MTVSIVVAFAKNNVIGKNNTLLWHLPADMKHFREITTGYPVIMGRKTFESIGHPLPNRRNIVITRDQTYQAIGAEIVHSLAEALNLFISSNEEIFIIGGGEIYKQVFSKADKIYLTEINKQFEGDTFFPEINKNQWKEVFREKHESDEENPISYSFVIYNKKII